MEKLLFRSISYLIKFDNKENSKLSVVVKTLTGQPIWEEYSSSFSGNFEKKIDLQNIARGIYFLEIKTGKENIFRKIVVK